MARGDAHIGTRVRYWRGRRGLSQVALAGLAGMSQAYLSQIETGARTVDSRATLARLAEALQVTTASLEGQPADPRTPEHSSASAAIPAVRAALVAASLGDDVTTGRGVDELAAEVDRAVRLRTEADYARLTPLLPDLISDLHAATCSADEQTARTALRLMVSALYCCTFTVKYLGYPDLAMAAADQAQRAAERLDDPTVRGIADFVRIQSLPPELGRLARHLSADAVDRLAVLADDPTAGQVYGMLHLVSARVAAVDRRTADVATHLAEARSIATRLGETTDGGLVALWFGPTNVSFWETAIAVELGEGGRVRELAAGVTPDAVRSATRQASWYADLGRGLAQTRRADQEAVAHLVRAERIAPQRVRLNPAVRDTVSLILRRVRQRSVSSDLRALAERVGTVQGT
ncbi:transcriptional regulator [Actinocatenispora thailandica]|uniref:Transcriptional regulator n=1 Tax=Actinocatenispora thailandica TaxID=227318 RepID=A0A7R7I0E2_9ACTN|nr:helix-turn-helix transcriptional regulator [Actinocatenispora thailandica]BCJ37943.1 transcriptional regulator [Actinocatenispora thailandica]